MDTLIERFPAQIAEALEIGEKAQINKHSKEINKVLVAGLGGSGIGADFVAELVSDECPIPYLVSKGYTLPAYVDENTLVIISSYSGNTEETLASFEQALTTGAKIVCIASGGKIIAQAKELGLDHIEVPGNWPSPRACLGYSLIQQIFVLEKLGFISNTIASQIKTSIDIINFNQEEIKAAFGHRLNSIAPK